MNYSSRLFIIVERVMINDHFSYINHYMKSNIVYFIIYLINRQYNFIIWYLKFIIFRVSNENRIQFVFLFFRFSVVFKQLIHIFYIYFMKAFNCDFCVKFVHDSHFLLLTLVIYAIVIIYLIALIFFSCTVDDVSNSRQYVFSHNKELNSK